MLKKHKQGNQGYHGYIDFKGKMCHMYQSPISIHLDSPQMRIKPYKIGEHFADKDHASLYMWDFRLSFTLASKCANLNLYSQTTNSNLGLCGHFLLSSNLCTLWRAVMEGTLIKG
ncbi:hypothetical protein TNCV_4421021 [Trichonephila clavipes]|nr:hypothetical protein TNCV_4421021 [Trichonephila clavipes]